MDYFRNCRFGEHCVHPDGDSQPIANFKRVSPKSGEVFAGKNCNTCMELPRPKRNEISKLLREDEAIPERASDTTVNTLLSMPNWNSPAAAKYLEAACA